MADVTPPSLRGPIAVIGLLLAASAAGMILRLEGMPGSQWLQRFASTAALEFDVARYAEEVLVVPLGALVAVVVRLTLGVRMLGPFRPVLIAMALEFTGIFVGVTFIVAVFAMIALLRPRLKTDWLPYASRLAIILVTVVVAQVVFVFVASARGWDNAIRGAFFPIIVLCLAADGFARVLADDGPAEACWRGTTTVLTAILIVSLLEIPGVAETLIAFPELMLAHIAAILVISRFGSWRLFEGRNPLRPPDRSVPQSEDDPD